MAGMAIYAAGRCGHVPAVFNDVVAIRDGLEISLLRHGVEDKIHRKIGF